LQLVKQTLQTAPSLQSAYPTQSYIRSCNWAQVSRSVALHETTAETKLKIACIDLENFQCLRKENCRFWNVFCWINSALQHTS